MFFSFLKILYTKLKNTKINLTLFMKSNDIQVIQDKGSLVQDKQIL